MNDPCHLLIVYRWLTIATIYDETTISSTLHISSRSMRAPAKEMVKSFVLDIQPHFIEERTITFHTGFLLNILNADTQTDKKINYK